ncbi:MAG: hypothetical protein BroJett013_30340 [Alphaproteobacteria bacterium]|nr:MAG: hypothetical protein BroJett013_30340 [Alphaproteobacteria bacterium]
MSARDVSGRNAFDAPTRAWLEAVAAVLAALRRKPYSTSKLIELTGLDRATFERLMSQMQRAGWVAGRGWGWTLTRLGREL